jgi:hypothetical protein
LTFRRIARLTRSAPTSRLSDWPGLATAHRISGAPRGSHKPIRSSLSRRSFDHLVGAGDEWQRDREAERFRILRLMISSTFVVC